MRAAWAGESRAAVGSPIRRVAAATSAARRANPLVARRRSRRARALSRRVVAGELTVQHSSSMSELGGWHARALGDLQRQLARRDVIGALRRRTGPRWGPAESGRGHRAASVPRRAPLRSAAAAASASTGPRGRARARSSPPPGVPRCSPRCGTRRSRGGTAWRGAWSVDRGQVGLSALGGDQRGGPRPSARAASSASRVARVPPSCESAEGRGAGRRALSSAADMAGNGPHATTRGRASAASSAAIAIAPCSDVPQPTTVTGSAGLVRLARPRPANAAHAVGRRVEQRAGQRRLRRDHLLGDPRAGQARSSGRQHPARTGSTARIEARAERRRRSASRCSCSTISGGDTATDAEQRPHEHARPRARPARAWPRRPARARARSGASCTAASRPQPARTSATGRDGRRAAPARPRSGRSSSPPTRPTRPSRSRTSRVRPVRRRTPWRGPRT